MTYSPWTPLASQNLPAAAGGSSSIFPILPGQSFKVLKDPIWSTVVRAAASGRERRTQIWPKPRWKFEVKYEVIRDRGGPTTSELQFLYEFFLQQAGRYNSFQFFDPDDYQATAVQFGTGDGTTTAFQLSRPIRNFVEPVYEIYSTPTIYDNGTPTGAFTLGANGVITFTSAPANTHVLTWTGIFYYRCRFDTDELKASQLMKQLWSAQGLTFMSLVP